MSAAVSVAARPLRILLIEDNPSDASYVAGLLDPAAVVISAAETLDEGLEILSRDEQDVVLLDLGLPDAFGVECVAQVRALSPSVALVVLTGLDEHSLALQCIAAGAQDFVVKRELGTSMLRRVIDIALARIGDRLASILDSSSDGILSMTPDGRITSWNHGAETIFGYSKREALGRPFTEVVRAPMGSDQEQRFRDIPDGVGSQKEYQTVRLNRWGHPKTLSVVNTTLCDNAGRIVAMASVIRDVSELRAREKQLIAMNQQLTARERQMQALAARMVDVREEERVRIAREVHDELGQLLTGLKLQLGLIQRRYLRETDPLSVQIGEAVALVDRTIATIQRIAVELRPSALDALGLAAAIQDEARRFQERTDITTFVNIDGVVRADAETETALFRIVQELLTNVARHSGASTVRISLRQENEHIALRVEDDGSGFPAEALDDSHSLGLLGMRERASLIGGRIELTAAADHGTVAVVTAPLSH